ncbi:hypothetical protein C8Q80DRAFT_519514 [Daedaleopsis nitida]|nr:hypothetical protein C8Q80DRAFT_519514 [Daedaleopsis nitida]
MTHDRWSTGGNAGFELPATLGPSSSLQKSEWSSKWRQVQPLFDLTALVDHIKYSETIIPALAISQKRNIRARGSEHDPELNEHPLHIQHGDGRARTWTVFPRASSLTPRHLPAFRPLLTHCVIDDLLPSQSLPFPNAHACYGLSDSRTSRPPQRRRAETHTSYGLRCAPQRLALPLARAWAAARLVSRITRRLNRPCRDISIRPLRLLAHIEP